MDVQWKKFKMVRVGDIMIVVLCIVFDTKVLKESCTTAGLQSSGRESVLREKTKKHPVPPAESCSPASAITVSGFSSAAVALT